MYRELLEELTKENHWATLREPCTEEDLAAAEDCVGCTFPEELRALLRETDGDGWFLLSAKEIIRNVELNRTYFPECFDTVEEYKKAIDNHIFFATNGCGDYYCYKIKENGQPDPSAIYLWEHELFESHAVAKDLNDAILKYYHDEI